MISALGTGLTIDRLEGILEHQEFSQSPRLRAGRKSRMLFMLRAATYFARSGILDAPLLRPSELGSSL
jgi:hypothetical protein